MNSSTLTNQSIYGSFRASAGSSSSLRMEVKNDAEFLEDTFPELVGKVNIVTAPFANPTQTYAAGSDLEQVLDPTGFQNIRNLKQFLEQKGIERPRILSLIDLQKDFLNGGSLMVPGAEEKVFAAIERLLKENARLIAAGQRGLFDVIIVTKDFHPEGHRSFTSKFFDLKEERFDTKRGFRLVLNEQGKAVGATVRKFWSLLPHIAAQFDFPENQDPHSFCLIPKTPASYAVLKKALQEGSIMPLSMGLHPVPVTAHMLRKVPVEDKGALFAKLKQIHLLDNRGGIDPTYLLNDVHLKDAFAGPAAFPPNDVTFNAGFVKGLAEKLELSEELAKQVLKALLENFWPDHCVQGSAGHQFHEKLVDLLARYAPATPLIPLPKGNTVESGEAYSAGRNTAGNLATPYLPLLKYLNAEKNFVCGTATGFCPSGAARDSTEAGIDGMETVYWTGASKGLSEPEEVATHQELTACGITVVEEFPGLAPAPMGGLAYMRSFASMSPAQLAALSNSSGSSSFVNPDLPKGMRILNDLFDNVDKINAHPPRKKFDTRIFLGRDTPGFNDKYPIPFSFASIKTADETQATSFQETIVDLKKYITVRGEPRWQIVQEGRDVVPAIKNMHIAFSYDPDHKLQQKFGLTFDAFLSEKAKINLPEAKAKAMGIHPKARSYVFVFPCEAIASPEFARKMSGNLEYYDELKEELCAHYADVKEIDSEYLAKKKQQFGEDFTSLVLIGGYAYFDENGELIQVKPIVGRSTSDTLPIDRAVPIGIVPKELRDEFKHSIEQIAPRQDGLYARDGLSNAITAPELSNYGARYFNYVPNDYYPETVKKAIVEAIVSAVAQGVQLAKVNEIIDSSMARIIRKAQASGVTISDKVVQEIKAAMTGRASLSREALAAIGAADPKGIQLSPAPLLEQIIGEELSEIIKAQPEGKLPENILDPESELGRKKAEFDLLWSKTAPFGLFIYKFAEEKYDCILPLAPPKPPAIDTSGKKAMKVKDIHDRNGPTQQFDITLEQECMMCGDTPDVVWRIDPSAERRMITGRGREMLEAPREPAYYKTVCCQACDQGMDDAQRKAAALGVRVTGRYLLESSVEQVADTDFYKVLHVKPVTEFRRVDLRELSLSKPEEVTVPDKADMNIPASATRFAFAYPAGNLTSKTKDPQIKAVYDIGGFVYYDERGDVVGINYITDPSAGGTKPIGFANLTELADLDPETRRALVALIEKEKLPKVTIPQLEEKGIEYFIWVRPKHPLFPSEHGQFVYFNGNASKVFLKQVKPDVRTGDHIFN